MGRLRAQAGDQPEHLGLQGRGDQGQHQQGRAVCGGETRGEERGGARDGGQAVHQELLPAPGRHQGEGGEQPEPGRGPGHHRPQGKKIQEIKNEARNIAVEHKNIKAAAENINVERKSSAGYMDRERKLSSGSAERKISTGSMERKSSMEKKSSMERKSSFSGSSASSTLGSEKSKKTTSMVPMNLRDSFFDDPLFQDNWLDIQKTQKNFFTQAQEQFRQQRERMESSMNESMNISNFFNKDFALSKFDDDFDFFKFNKDFGFSKMSLKDAHELSVKETEESLEIKLDTAGFKPDELRVTAGSGVVSVEGKHEEKTEKGESMLSRMMSRQYPLPAQARPSDVVSNLSRDGILVVTVPKSKQIKQGERNVPIEMNN